MTTLVGLLLSCVLGPHRMPLNARCYLIKHPAKTHRRQRGTAERRTHVTTDLIPFYTKTSFTVYSTSANPPEHGSKLHDNLNPSATPSHNRNLHTESTTMGFLLIVFLLLVIAAGAVYTWVLIVFDFTRHATDSKQVWHPDMAEA